MTNKNVEINRVSSISGQIIPLASSTSHSLSPIPAGNLKGKQEQAEEFYLISDERTQEEKEEQTEVSNEIHHRNLQLFGIEMTVKKKVEYQPSKLFKVDVGDGWFGMITDNEIENEIVMFTVHGSPGDHKEWAGLENEMNGKVRWINFIVPGFDGLDERRGNYTGSAEDLSKLIVKILDERKVSKIIFIGHSMGSIFGSYFIHRFPEVVQGYVNVTGIVNQWYIGLMTFYRNTSAAYGFGKGPQQTSMIRLLNKNEFREKHHEKFISDIREIRFSPRVPFPELTITEMCAYIKLLSSLPKGCSQFYELNQQIPLLRVLLFGKIDPIHEVSKTDEQIYSITRGRLSWNEHPQNAKLISCMKKELEATIKEIYGVAINAEQLQEYFCYHFDETGHNVHKRRPKEISRILKIYISVLKIIDKYKPVLESRL